MNYHYAEQAAEILGGVWPMAAGILLEIENVFLPPLYQALEVIVGKRWLFDRQAVGERSNFDRSFSDLRLCKP